MKITITITHRRVQLVLRGIRLLYYYLTLDKREQQKQRNEALAYSTSTARWSRSDERAGRSNPWVESGHLPDNARYGDYLKLLERQGEKKGSRAKITANEAPNTLNEASNTETDDHNLNPFEDEAGDEHHEATEDPELDPTLPDVPGKTPALLPVALPLAGATSQQRNKCYLRRNERIVEDIRHGVHAQWDDTKLTEVFLLYLEVGSTVEEWFEGLKAPSASMVIKKFKEIKNALLLRWPAPPQVTVMLTQRRDRVLEKVLREEQVGEVVNDGGYMKGTHMVWAEDILKLATDVGDATTMALWPSEFWDDMYKFLPETLKRKQKAIKVQAWVEEFQVQAEYHPMGQGSSTTVGTGAQGTQQGGLFGGVFHLTPLTTQTVAQLPSPISQATATTSLFVTPGPGAAGMTSFGTPTLFTPQGAHRYPDPSSQPCFTGYSKPSSE
ncbi:hypothetical protein FRB90_007299 [Tulasnella sp. 427]|nr:hypothetical protein FRB90_007299 [Tulasnella sp. 427]